MALNLKDYRSYAFFERRELKEIIISALVIGLIAGFKDNRTNSSGLDLYYLVYLLFAILFALIAFFFKEIIKKSVALFRGMTTRFFYCPFGLFYSFLFTLASNGAVWIFAPGYVRNQFVEFTRVGFFRYQPGRREVAWVAVGGVFANIFLALLIKSINIGHNPFLDLFMKINLGLAIFALLPFPQFDGIFIFTGQRWMYFLAVGIVAAGTVAVFLLSNLILLILFTLIMGGLLGFVITHGAEKN